MGMKSGSQVLGEIRLDLLEFIEYPLLFPIFALPKLFFPWFFSPLSYHLNPSLDRMNHSIPWANS
jgi:hypothetical protein